MISLSGKTALVTGGGAGIGRAVVEQFAALGANVAVAEIDPARAADVKAELGKSGQKHLVATADVRNQAQVEGFVADVDRTYGRLDVLVNNVGHHVFSPAPFEQGTNEQWNELFSTNLLQVFMVTRAAIPLMRKSGDGGSIINFSTIECFRARPNLAVYSAVKAGVAAFTRSLAMELGPYGIRVNDIAVETTQTPQANVSSFLAPEHKEIVKLVYPLGRFGRPEDAAGCAVFLATELSAWVTGTSIHNDGGGLAAGGWYQTPAGSWTNAPVVSGSIYKYRGPHNS